MGLLVTPYSMLDENRISALNSRVAAPEHRFDNGPCNSWNTPSYFPCLYAISKSDPELIIGILYAGGPKTKIDVGWWLDSLYRGKGYASEAIDLLACHLKNSGVTGVGNILVDTFQGNYHDASSKLLARFKAHF